MSKNTERGIGLQGGPADGQGEPSAPASGAPKPGEATRTERAASEPQRHAVVDTRPVTLLGVPSPLADREKVTALGRDVHLPMETHRVAASRPIAVQQEAPGPVTARGSGVPDKPEPARPEPSKVEVEAALEARNPEPPRSPSVVPERASPPSQASKPTRPTHPADRATFDASPLVVGEESSDEILAPAGMKAWLRPSLRPSIGLGIGMAFALSIGLVSIVKYTTLDEGEEEPYAEDNTTSNRPATPAKGTEKGVTDKGVTDQARRAALPPSADTTKAVATGGAAAEAAETQDEEPALLPPLPVGPARDPAGKDAYRAPPRSRAAATLVRKSPTEDSTDATATGGNAANAGTAVTPPPLPAKPATPNQPYDPDSPLPPAGE